MKKYPWDNEKEINWLTSYEEIVGQQTDRYYDLRERFVDYYFSNKIYRIVCIYGWGFSSILLYLLWATNK